MSKQLSLVDLQVKPMPNKKQKTGVDAYLGIHENNKEFVTDNKEFVTDNKKFVTDNKEVLQINEDEEVSIKAQVSIISKIDTKYDRKSVIDRISSRNLFSVKRLPIDPQMKILSEELTIEPKAKESEPKAKESEPKAKENEPKEKESEKNLVKGDKIIKIKKQKAKEEPIDLGKVDISAIEKRIPKKNATVLKASPYYMTNRKLYIEKIAPLFKDYERELTDEEKVTSCESQKKATNFELLTHQKVVRDYLNIYSPYRGLLLYHGLGTGKTISSIAIAEGLKSHNHIYVMTLASLKMNFFTQMKDSGDELYKKNQFWEFVSVEGDPGKIGVLAKALSLTPEYVKSRGGAWLTDISKQPNFNDLAESDQKAVDAQIDQMIRAKYTDINYNGLNRSKMNELTDGNKRNPFDNSVVIVDEAHNFVSRIVNKIKDKKSISYMLYEYLMSATNCRVVFLSGTPIINYPNEIGVLFNMLRGYIKTWTFPVRLREGVKEKPNRENILAWFERDNFKTYDYVEFSGDYLTITRNPFGFINVMNSVKGRVKKGGSKKKGAATNKRQTKKRELKKDVENGLVKITPINGDLEPESEETSEIRRNHIGPNGPFDLRKGGQSVSLGGGAFEDYNGVVLDDTGNVSDADFVKTVVRILGKNGLDVVESAVKLTNNKALPDDSKSFLELFVDTVTKEMKNRVLFQRRVLGLTSYFNSVQPGLLPRFVPANDDPIYHIVRSEMSKYQFEVYKTIRSEESKKESNNKKAKAQAEKKGQEDIFKISTTYRIRSRTSCNFVFPDFVDRPMKSANDYGGEEEIVDLEEVGEEQVVVKKARVIKKKGGTKKEEKKPDTQRKTKKIKPVVEEEADEEEESEEEKESEEEEEAEEEKEEPDESEEEKEESEEPDSESYGTRVRNALIALKKRENDVFTPEHLATYSPKFLKILENLQNKDHTGLHLIYSQFRTLEGIGILKLVLEANGYVEFKLEKGAGSQWKMADLSEEDAIKPRFVLYTGTESPEEKEIIRNIYNSNWSSVPESIITQIKELGKGVENNIMGEVIKIFMITASGAEGINLKNTRYVHIVEPYWHMVRLDQVIGRARRICSHVDLPEELRTVQVFLYISVFTADQNTTEKYFDISKLNRKSGAADWTMYDRYLKTLDEKPATISTDQLLLENALTKDRINSQILTAAKETAMDCQLYVKGHSDEHLKCFDDFGKVGSNAFGTYPELQRDLAEKDVKETKLEKAKLIKITKDGTNYALNDKTKEVFLYTDYEKNPTLKGVLPFGILRKDGSILIIKR